MALPVSTSFLLLTCCWLCSIVLMAHNAIIAASTAQCLACVHAHHMQVTPLLLKRQDAQACFSRSPVPGDGRPGACPEPSIMRGGQSYMRFLATLSLVANKVAEGLPALVAQVRCCPVCVCVCVCVVVERGGRGLLPALGTTSTYWLLAGHSLHAQSLLIVC
jgi:hypothetical protein